MRAPNIPVTEKSNKELGTDATKAIVGGIFSILFKTSEVALRQEPKRDVWGNPVSK